VVDELHANNDGLWNDLAHVIGVDDPNDFINGQLRVALRPIFVSSTFVLFCRLSIRHARGRT
jgi:hypothetical protein